MPSRAQDNKHATNKQLINQVKTTFAIFITFILFCFGGKSFAVVEFDGQDDYMTTNLTTAFGDATVCAWFYYISVPWNGYMRIVDKSYSTGFWLGSGSTQDTWGGGFIESSSPYGQYVSLSSGTWNHICIVRSGTTHTVIGNGGDVSASKTASSTACSADNVVFDSDTTSETSNNKFHGYIEDIRIYSRALSSQEIESLANSQLKYHSITSNLVGYWPLDDFAQGTSGDAKTFIDQSGNGNSATGIDGANNLGLTVVPTQILSYP